MAFIAGCDHDVFVSYAHLDDQGESAWVTTLVRHLNTEVRQRLGTKDLRIWIDHNLDGNRQLNPEVMQVIQRSAILLVVMSPSVSLPRLAASGCHQLLKSRGFTGISNIWRSCKSYIQTTNA